MTDDIGTASGTPGGSPSGNTGAQSFVAARSAQISEAMERQGAQSAESAGDVQHEPAGQQQATPPAEQTRVGENGYPQEVNDALARDAEARIRRQSLPQSPNDFQAKLPPDWQAPVDLPPGFKFEFDQNSPELAKARKIAHARGMDQETFSDMLGVYAATKISEQTHAARAREVNLQQLGAAGPQRVDAVATWLQARAGNDGKQVANFIRQYPSAPIVRAMEILIRQFSSQGGTDYSQSHRETAETEGKIPGYDQMNFTQRRVAQMALMMNKPGYRGGGRER